MINIHDIKGERTSAGYAFYTYMGTPICEVIIKRECIGGGSVPDYADVAYVVCEGRTISRGGGFTYDAPADIEQAFWYCMGAIGCWEVLK